MQITVPVRLCIPRGETDQMKAMVLGAGFGTRLGDLTRETPKPMLPVDGRPMLEHIVRHLADNGYDQICVNLHFMPEVITSHFGDGSDFGVKIYYSYEPDLLGTAGGVRRMAELLQPEEDFIVHYGDIITNQDFVSMQAFHREQGALCTLLLHQRTRSNSIVILDKEQRIVEFLERPDRTAEQYLQQHWVNSGVAILSPGFLDFIPASSPCDLPRDIYSKIFTDERLFGYPLTGFRCAVDSAERLEAVRLAISQGLVFRDYGSGRT